MLVHTALSSGAAKALGYSVAMSRSAGKPLLVRNANFRALWISSTTGLLGTSVAAVALPLIAALELGASNFQVAALGGMTYLPWLLFGLPIGALVDRYRRKPVIISSLLARIILLASLPVAYWVGMLGIVQLFVVAFLAGLAAVFFTLAEAALVPRAVDREDLIEGNGLMTGSAASADAAGRGLAGWLTEVWGASNTLLIQVGASVAALASLGSLNVSETAQPAAGRRIGREMADGLRYALSTTPLRVLLFVAALWNLGGNIAISVLVLLVIRTIGESALMLGIVTASLAVGGTLGGLAVKGLTDRLGSGRVWRYSMFPAAAGYASLLFMTPGWGMLPGIVGMFLNGFFISMNIVVSTSFRQRVCPPMMMGRLGSANRMVSWGMLAIAAFAGGALATALGVREAVFAGLCVALLAPLLAVLGPLRGIRHLEELEPAQEA